ncbi:MAG: zinc-binding dehydrogenase [Verrucomicrobia bacterium]|nr:zinc-binding dehydrogenase [Verrucomicrobiota bacterium]
MSATMPGIVNYALKPHSVELREVPVPEIGGKDVLFRVEAASICGSDLHQWTGTISWTVNYPCILGHEFAGTIVQTGKEVKGFREGDRVVSETAAVIDEQSPYARRGLYNLDPNRLGFGYGGNGAMTQLVKVPERCLHRIPEGLSFEKAALTEPCSVAYNAVCMNGHIRPGDSVLIIGPGPIGLLCAIMAKLSGAGTLLVCGLEADKIRLNVAEKLGAKPLLVDEVLPFVKEHGDRFGLDAVIDATGASASLQLAMNAIRPAGQIIKVGWGPQPLGFNIDPIVQKAVTLQGSFSHNWPIWERVIHMIASGQIDLDLVINRVAPLDEWHDCFERMHAGEYVKAILKPNG